MSGSRITMQQVRFYMSNRKQGQTPEQASAKAGVSQRSGRLIDSGRIGVLETKGRDWRTRKDPFAEVWDSEVVELLEHQPGLDAPTLFENVQDRHPGRFGNGGKRTFQRRVKAWKALHGADKEVMFRQVQEPGRQGLSDFTELKGIAVTLVGMPLTHRLYHFRLAYSGWSHVKVVLGGASFRAPWPRGCRRPCGAWEGPRRSTAPTASRRPTRTSRSRPRMTSPNATRACVRTMA